MSGLDKKPTAPPSPPALRPVAGEPTIDEILAEPIIRMMMDRDHVRCSDLRNLIATARRRRAGRLDAH